MAAAFLLMLFGSLAGEVDGFLEEYAFHGYTIQWSRPLYLSLGDPCTLWTFPPGELRGVVSAAGGPSVLNLEMELITPYVNITDEFPDDLPVLEFSTGSEPGLCRVVVTAADMLFGATADSAYVFCALQRERAENEISDPDQPE